MPRQMLGLLLLALSTSASLAACPPGAIQGINAGDCYHARFQYANMDTAEQKCTSYGGHLVSVTNAFTNKFIYNISSDVSGNIAYLWLGARWNGQNWTWIDGSPWKYTNWVQGMNLLLIGHSYLRLGQHICRRVPVPYRTTLRAVKVYRTAKQSSIKKNTEVGPYSGRSRRIHIYELVPYWHRVQLGPADNTVRVRAILRYESATLVYRRRFTQQRCALFVDAGLRRQMDRFEMRRIIGDSVQSVFRQRWSAENLGRANGPAESSNHKYAFTTAQVPRELDLQCADQPLLWGTLAALLAYVQP